MCAVDDPAVLPEPEGSHGFAAHTTTIQIEVGPRLNDLLISWFVALVALVVFRVIG